MIRLTLQLNGKFIREYRFQDDKTVKIGRRGDNDVVIDNLAVSGRHAKIEGNENGFFLVDLDSTNGSLVNDNKVSSQQLRNGDVITIGKHTLLFVRQEDPQSAACHEGMDQTVMMDADSFKDLVANKVTALPSRDSRTDLGVLSYLSGGKGQVVLSKKLVRIGKDVNSDIVVPGLLVSKTAATISKRANGYYLSYAGGLAKPRINGKSVKSTVLLNEADIIQLGSVRMKLLYDKAS